MLKFHIYDKDRPLDQSPERGGNGDEYWLRHITSEQMLKEQLKPAFRFYPGWEKWYHDKFLPGVENGERKVVVLRDGDELVGIAITKEKDEEYNECKKICTFFIFPAYRKKGYGQILMNEVLKQFSSPSGVWMTVARERDDQLKALLIKNNFVMMFAVPGKYLPRPTSEIYYQIQ